MRRSSGIRSLDAEDDIFPSCFSIADALIRGNTRVQVEMESLKLAPRAFRSSSNGASFRSHNGGCARPELDKISVGLVVASPQLLWQAVRRAKSKKALLHL